MQFCEKLDLIMNITNTSNSALGQKVRLDPSHISRLRRGQRNATKNELVICAMSDYFARKCTLGYQQKALLGALNISTANFDPCELSSLIAVWLCSGKTGERKTVENFLDGLTRLKETAEPPKTPDPEDRTQKASQDNVVIYYGLEGKQQACERFLTEVIAQGRPQTVFLYSDEPTDWLTANRDFTKRWSQLMAQAISKGIRIKIIHTVSRDLDEMLCAIRHWIPLYMSGAIEPYYDPRKRGGVFKRTLFIAPDVSAVISNSVVGMTANAANMLFKDKAAIAAFTEEFHQYLTMCKPLMQIFTIADEKPYLETLKAFEKEKSASIIKTESLSLLTMPKSVSAGIFSRVGIEKPYLIDYQEQRRQNFEEKLQTNTFYEILSMPDWETVKNNTIKVSFSDIMNGGSVYYTKQEYLEHLGHLLHLLKTFENFHIKFIKHMPESNYMVYAKEEQGAIVAKTSAPPIILATNEINLTTAFWDFLVDIIGERDYRSPNNQKEAGKLKEFMRRIKNI